MLPSQTHKAPTSSVNALEKVNYFDLSELLSNLYARQSNDVQTHLAKVYRLLAVVLLTSVVGAAMQIKYFLLSQYVFPYIIALFGLIIAIQAVDKKKWLTRIGLAMSFGFVQGIVIGPIVNKAVDIDPFIVRAALVLTFCVFASFSIIAMLTKKKKYLFLGSILNSFCMFLLFMRIFPTPYGYELSLYGGLVMFIGYVFYDTQRIIARVERCGLDEADWISDAITLYIDFVAIFIRILIIIMRSKEKNGGSGSRPLLKTRVKMDL